MTRYRRDPIYRIPRERAAGDGAAGKANILLEINNLSVDYYAASGTVHALSDVSITLERGQILGLVGESGSGKSTLAYAITRLLHPPAVITEGEILYYPRPGNPEQQGRRRGATQGSSPSHPAAPAPTGMGTEIGQGATGVRKEIGRGATQGSSPSHPAAPAPTGMGTEPVDILRLSAGQLRAFRWSELSIVFQSAMNALNPVLNIGTQIMDVLHTHRPEMGRDSQRRRAIELLRLVGIAPDRIRSYPHELSGGMRQRAIIAIALALSPEIIILDEPTTALDVVVQREILMKIIGLRNDFGFSVIFITHDLSLLLEMADKIAVMYAGRIVETGTSRELQHQPRHPYSYGLLNSFPTLHGPRRRMTGIPGSPPDLRTVPPGCAFHLRCPCAFDACSTVLPVLHPSTPETPGQVVACHLYDRSLNAEGMPNNADFAAKYEAKYQALQKVTIYDAAPGDLPMGGDPTQGDPRVPAQPLNLPRPYSVIGPVDGGQAVLEAVHLRKYFPLHQFKLFGPQSVVHAAEDTSLALYPGRALALVGESGSGKTTMARMLARLYEPSAGTIKFRGEPVKVRGRADLRAYRRHVQIVFQDPFSSLNPVHNVRYHLSRPLRLYSAHSAVSEREQVLALLNRVSLSPAEQFITKFPHQLSGGQRQRVAIARALAARPEVLLADEPVSMLDVSIRLDVLNLLLRLKDEERLALLFITHDIASARYFAEDTLVMYAGQTVEGGPSEEVIQQPRHPYTQLLISAAPDPDHTETDERNRSILARGEIPSLINPPSGCRFHPRCPHAMPVCSQRFPGRTDLGGGHWTHCFLYGDGTSGGRPQGSIHFT